MKKFVISAATALVATCSLAQTAQDPVIMRIAGEDVPRSEFEYSYNKNNSDGVIDKKSVDEYVDLFINYKLKVRAAQDAQIDTTEAFKKEFATYRDQQIRPAMITDEDVEREARRIYKETQEQIDSTGGLVKPAHILVMVKPKATDDEAAAAKARIDSLYAVLRDANFSEDTFAQLAKDYSDDKGTSKNGGELSWIPRGRTLPEFDDKVFSMQVGETSEPVKTSAGYHIIQLRDKGNFFPYDSLRTSIMSYIAQRGIKNMLINQKLDSIAKAQGDSVTRDMVLAQKREEMEAADPDLKYLIKEYHDGLMLYEISNQNVWDKADKDTLGLANFFKKNKKRYKWDAPRFKGIAYRTKDEADIAAVKAAIKGVKYDDWNETLRSTFNNDSVLRIRVEKGVFKRGDNAIIDNYEYNDTAKVKEMKGYPHTAAFGRFIKQPETYTDVRGLVVADYQETLEKAWVAELRKKYPVEVDPDVLATVNNH
ncbi:MAG: peptidylprolyl isomerase [Prevotella sp.]|nr:peptidylprolyl isomerase [Prevotella sp.]